MSNVIVVQSHTQPLPHAWLQTCIESVKKWAALNQFAYHYFDDELFSFIPVEIYENTKDQKVIATDLARLKILQDYLNKGFETVIWCDADFLIFNPNKFKLTEEAYALGREVWVQEDVNNSGKLVTHVKVHNAFMLYRKNNAFLDFYTETAEKLLIKNTGTIPPQFIGPKLLTALHNIAQCPVQETAGMLSPLVMKDIAAGGGEAIDMFRQKSVSKVYAANLCNSLFGEGGYSANVMDECLKVLFREQTI